MSKPTIFLSHITEEGNLAGIFKDQIEKSFLGLVDIFVSSDAKSVPLGKNWLDQVTEGLRSCKAMLLLCSPASIGRPWINFEAGAAWAREIEVAPICHSGLRPVDLPLPMSLLQGLEANDAKRIYEVFQLIARQLGSDAPEIDVTALVEKVTAFEAPYIVRLRLAADAKALKSLNPRLVATINAQSPGTTFALNQFLERDFVQVRPHLDNLQASGGLQYAYNVTGILLGGPAGGSMGELTMNVSQPLHELLKT